MTLTSWATSLHFNPRSPRGERRSLMLFKAFTTSFQSTLPARGATRTATSIAPEIKFQSTLPARGATVAPGAGRGRRSISIHAPREGSDWHPTGNWRVHIYFNPRSPRGERLQGLRLRGAPCTGFQSTLPARGATGWGAGQQRPGRDFNPRSPRGERPLLAVRPAGALGFQSTLPARGATPRCDYHKPATPISIHAPREGSDAGHAGARPATRISIHAPREGSDRKNPI